MRHELEETLGVIAYDILPFDEEYQIYFLTEYWTNISHLKFCSNLSLFAKICLKHFKRDVTSNERDIGGIPLQCRLIAEVQSKAAQRYSEASKELLDDIYVKIGKSMFEIYNKFINLKFNIEENYALSLRKPGINSSSKIFDQKLRNYHHCLALHTVFPELQQKTFQPNHFNDCLTKNAMMSCGLLEEVYNGNDFSFQFIHKTVAEYLAAEYVANYLTEFEYEASCNHLRSFCSCFTNPETKWDFLIKCSFKNALKVHRIKRNNISKRKNLCTFTYPTVLYFLDHQIKALAAKPTLRLTKYMAKNLNSTEVYEIFESCGHHNFENIYCFIETICKSNLKKYKSVLTKNLYVLVSVFCEFSSRELVEKCIAFVNTLCSITLDDMLQGFTTRQIYYTPLEYACRRRSYDLLEYFLNQNCSTKGKLLLHICIENSVDLSLETIQKTVMPMVNLLLDHNPDLIHELNSADRTCLLVNRSSFHLIKLLIQRGADLEQKDGDGNTEVHKISDWISSDDFHSLSVFLVKECVTRRILKSKNLLGNTPLHCALFFIKSLKADTVQLILKKNEVDVNETNKQEENLLIAAIKGSQSVKLLKVMIEHGADYGVQHSNMEWNLLHLAANIGNSDIFYYLLTLGIDDLQPDKYGRTPFYLLNEH